MTQLSLDLVVATSASRAIAEAEGAMNKALSLTRGLDSGLGDVMAGINNFAQAKDAQKKRNQPEPLTKEQAEGSDIYKDASNIKPTADGKIPEYQASPTMGVDMNAIVSQFAGGNLGQP